MQAEPQLAVATETQAPPLRLTFVGHATMLIELPNARLLTDPLLRGGVGPLRSVARRLDPVWLEDIDAVLLSHAHRDHLDPHSLALLRDVPLIAPQSVARTLGLRRRRVETVAPGDEVVVGGHVVRATPARHGRPGSAVGYLVDGVYFAGDTDLFPGMAELAPATEVALLPVWGWGPTLGAGHLDPARAVEALRLLRPRIAVPIHWGTLHPPGLGGRRFMRDPPHTFARLARAGAPEVDVCVLPIGGTLTVP